MVAFQQTRFGLPSAAVGSSLYGNTGIVDWEQRVTGSNGLGKRLSARTYWRKFGDAFTTGGDDTRLFKQGNLVHVSISNFQDPSFTYNAGASGSWDTVYLDPLCTRIAALPFNSAVAAGSTYTSNGGNTLPYIKLTFQHEVNAKTKAGAFGSTVAATPSEWKAFNAHFNSRLVHFGIRDKVQLVFVSTGGITYSTLDPYWDASIFDEYGVDLYCNMSIPSFTWNGTKTSYASQLAPALAWARSKGTITKMSHPEFGVGDFHDSSMTTWFTDMANYLKTITDIKFTDVIHWGQANHADQNLNALAAQDTGTGVGHPEKHAGAISFMSIMGANVATSGSSPTTPPAPTGLTVTPSVSSLHLTWATLGSPGDSLDFYLQGPSDGFLHKVNTGGALPAATTHSFDFNGLFSSTAYQLSMVLSDSTTALRSGFATPVVGTTSTPGSSNNAPVIDTTSATVDPADPLHYTLAAVAHDPDVGQTITYSWVITNQRTGVSNPAVTGSSIEFHAQTEDDYNALLTVKDSAVPPLSTLTNVPFSTSLTPGSTDFLHIPVITTGMDIRQAGPISRSGGAIIDDFAEQVYFRKSSHNAIFNLAASSMDPRTLSGTNTFTPSAQDLIYAVMKMEDVQGIGFATVTSRAMIGSGIVIGFWDLNGVLLDSYTGMDHLLTQTLGAVDEPFPNILTDLGPDDLFIGGIWHPNSGVSTQPIYRTGGVGTVEALVNAPTINGNPRPAYGGLSGTGTTFPTQLDFSLWNSSIGSIFLAVTLNPQ